MIPSIILAIEDDDDREFMTWLYKQYQRLMYREILKIVQETWDVDDIMQSLLVKLIGQIALLKTLDRQHLIDYLVTAARNTALNFRRDNKAKYFEELTDEQPSPEDTEDELIRKEDLYRLADVWNTLDEKTQYLLRARYILNKSGKEIAADLKMSPDNVRMAIVRAKRKAIRRWKREQTLKKKHKSTGWKKGGEISPPFFHPVDLLDLALHLERNFSILCLESPSA